MIFCAALSGPAIAPRASRALASLKPIKPPPPVMTTFTRRLLFEEAADRLGHRGGVLRQPQHDLGDVSEYDERSEERDEPRQYRHCSAFHRKLRRARQHEQHRPERRVKEADHEV